MCGTGQGEALQLSRVTTPKARKTHVCSECGSIISPGEKYERTSGLLDRFKTYKTCLFCADVRDQAYSDHDLMLGEGIETGRAHV